MSRYIGNYLRVPSSEPQQASAPGIWSLSEQLNYQRANQWPPARDPYYNQTVLHLSGDVAGTKETNPVTQPRTFLSDASTNNFLLTPNGDVSARPFSPYASSYSNYFDGSGDNLSIANNAALQFGSGNFTIECWIYPNSASGSQLFLAKGNGSSLSGSEWDFRTDSGTLGLYCYISPGETSVVINGGVPTLNQWNHVAAIRNGSTLSIFLNGNRVATSNSISTSSLNVTGTSVTIASNAGSSQNNYMGYISNVRLVKGTAVYTTNFTPPTTPLENIAGTSLLTCQANRFKDNSSNNFTVTPAGNVAVAQNSPFVDYDTTSGSGYFKAGTTDYLTSSSSTAFAFGNSDWTVESWIYLTAYSSGVEGRWWLPSSGGDNIDILGTSGNSGKLFYYNGSSGITATNAIPLNQWTHIAVTRVAGTVNFYLNGTLNGGGSISSPNKTSAVVTYVGGYPGAQSIVGYISDFRVVKGTAVYTGAFVPPSIGLLKSSGAESAVAYINTNNVNTTFASSATSLLTLQTRAPANNQGILDTSPNNFVVTRTGNVAQGSFSPFSQSGWSVYTGGTGNYITAASNANFAIGTTGTVEGWYYWTVENELTSNNTLNKRLWSVTNNLSNLDAYLSNRNVYMHGGMGVNTTSANLQVNTWYHIAAVYNSGTIKIFVNGVQQTLAGTTTGYNITGSGAFGINTLPGQSPYEATGYASNVRVVKGTALYISNFTPSTNPLTYVDGTVLLTCQSPNFIDNGPNRLTISPTGSPKIQPFSQFAPTQAYVASQLGGSAYFDSSGDSLTIPSAPALNMTGDFCMEAWAYPTTAGISFAWKYTAGVVSTSEYFWAIDGTNQLSVALDGGGGEDYFRTAANTITLNAWNHCVITRVGTAVRQFINGVLQSYNTTSRTLNITSTNFSTSANSGYISGLRIMRGSIPDIYQTTATTTGTTIFTPPTTPVISVPGTSLLYNFTGAGIVDASGKNNLETVNNICVTTNQAKFDYVKGGASIQFDGNLDQLTLPTSQLYALGTGNFTIELWAYSLDSGASLRSIIDFRTATTGTNGLMLRENSGGFLVWTNSGTVLSTTTGRTANTWQHIALVRASGVLSLYVDGLFQTSVSYTTNLTDSLLRIGGFVDTAASPYGYYGSISNIRITKAARYSGTSTSALNFPLPTGSFPLG